MTLDDNTDVCRNPACPANDIVREAIAMLEADEAPCPHGFGNDVVCVQCQKEGMSARAARIATAICVAVAELPDRTSPDDWPDAMIVTTDELAAIVEAEIAEDDQSVTLDTALLDWWNANPSAVYVCLHDSKDGSLSHGWRTRDNEHVYDDVRAAIRAAMEG